MCGSDRLGTVQERCAQIPPFGRVLLLFFFVFEDWCVRRYMRERMRRASLSYRCFFLLAS